MMVILVVHKLANLSMELTLQYPVFLLPKHFLALQFSRQLLMCNETNIHYCTTIFPPFSLSSLMYN